MNGTFIYNRIIQINPNLKQIVLNLFFFCIVKVLLNNNFCDNSISKPLNKGLKKYDFNLNIKTKFD
jgi:hypothetical protein